MHITTNESQMSRQEFFWLFFKRALKQRAILWLLLLGGGVYQFMSPGAIRPMGFALTGAAVTIPVLVAVLLLRAAYDSGNTLAFAPRRFEFDDEFVKSFMPDGSQTQLRYCHVTRAYKSATSYILLIAKTQYMFIPYQSFKSEDDRHEFEMFLVGRHWL